MSPRVGQLLQVAYGAGLTFSFLGLFPGGLERRLTRKNYRHRPIAAVGGVALAAAVLTLQVAADLNERRRGMVSDSRFLAYTGAFALVFVAGLADDLRARPDAPRGLRAHGRAFIAGQFSTGVLKLVLIVMGAVLVVITNRRGLLVGLVGIAAMAGCANLWNGLDVVPGRALKLFLVSVAPLVVLHPFGLLLRSVGGGLAVLGFDLRERTMLGDSGANLLGFVVGMSFYLLSGSVVIVVVALAAVGLNLLAETVTLSRIIEAAPPLRWFDRLGRLPMQDANDQSREDSSTE